MKGGVSGLLKKKRLGAKTTHNTRPLSDDNFVCAYRMHEIGGDGGARDTLG